MLKGRGRDANVRRYAGVGSPQSTTRPAAMAGQQRALPAKPEPDYEVVEFPSDQYVNAKLQPPPPPPPRPPTGHPVQAGASCGLCGGGGARVRCSECGRRALCASCDDMYHRHPKRRHHQRQALSPSQLGEDRPPLPPKGTPPVPPPRRHKTSGSPMPPMTPLLEQRRPMGHGHGHGQATMIGAHPHTTMLGSRASASPTLHHQPLLVQTKMVNNTAQMGSIPFLQKTMPHQQPMHMQHNASTLGHLNAGWNRPRGSLQGFNVPQVQEPWESSEIVHSPGMVQGQPQWGRPMRRGASTLELGGNNSCPGCAHCGPQPWRYGSCAALDQPWVNPGWPVPQFCPPQSPHGHFHMHPHMTPQPYRRADSRAMSRTASRTGSRAASPALSVRSRASRRTKPRSPSPPLPSSDADSESESDEPDRKPAHSTEQRVVRSSSPESPGAPSAPPTAPWQCEHCTYVNEAGVRVCVICCKTATRAPSVVPLTHSVERMTVANRSASPIAETIEAPRDERPSSTSKKDRTSTGCGPSPPREEKTKKSTQRLVTPTREHNGSVERQSRHDMAVGPSPPKETIRNGSNTGSSQETRPTTTPVERHSISVGPSPPRDSSESLTGQKKFVGTSPARDVRPESRSASIAGKTNVSNTGTSPPPQNISTQTYEDPSTYELAPSTARSRPRRRFREDRRERSTSRQSLSSDTRESERSIRTSGAWEWRERDSSPGAGGVGGEWRGKLARRASHLDLRREVARRTSLYGSEAPSPEPATSGGRAISMEVLSGAGRSTERGLELARLLAEAERQGYSAAEVQVGLSQSPGAPLSWLRSRWAGLVGAVQGAAARLAPGVSLSEEVARAALARHRGAVWPAVTECVDAVRHKTEKERVAVSSEGRLRGRVWGSPAGADAEGAPRAREDSSDEFEYTPTHYLEDEWAMDADYEVDREIDLWRVPPVDPMPYDPTLEQHPGDSPKLNLPDPSLYTVKTDISTLDPKFIEPARSDPNPEPQAVDPRPLDPPPLNALTRDTANVALKLRSLLLEAGIPSVDENLLLKGLLNTTATEPDPNKPSLDIQSENDFIDAYNALTRASPLPNINKGETQTNHTESNAKEQLTKDDESQQPYSAKIIKNISHDHLEQKSHPTQQINGNANHIYEVTSQQEPIAAEEALRNKINLSNNEENKHVTSKPSQASLNVNQSNGKDIFGPNLDTNRQTEDRASNLNDIVDNTHKLIQQMKEEINSDIHSLDDGHSETSRSDHSSSHDEQESSYGETDEETNNSMTSDEKEITSSEDEHIHIDGAPKSGASINRTSSEDNEQFEEALDNLDNQIEDVKHANIEMLDSIARSLQEEHTITLEINDSNPNNHTNNFHARYMQENDFQNITDSQNIPAITNAIKPIHLNKKDPNNNRFVAVNSFEEIYEGLDTSNRVITPIPQINKQLNVMPDNFEKETERNENLPSEPKNMLSKYPITETIFKVVSPTRVTILDYKEPSYNAVVENTEIYEENNTIETNGVDMNVNVNIDFYNANQLLNVDIQEILETDHLNDFSNTSALKTLINDTVEATETITELIQGDQMMDLIPKEAEDPQVTIGQQTQADTQNTKNNEDVIPSQNGIIKRDTPETSPKHSTKEVNRNKGSPTKSNIPKPVRTTAINKPKNDKSAPKLLVSKVPVRRGSLKQHHAPAPPKAHFGNVQSGHVKQLQSKIFNSKDTKTLKPQATEIEVKPSTSDGTLKKGQAPGPPIKSEPNSSHLKTSPPIDKKNKFFRETCRTEDEWTESDSDESQIIRQTSVEEVKQPSPPPPITLRRVSGHLIDLARVRLPDGSPERQARMLLAEGATETWEQAHLAVELVSRGTELPAALLAALQCVDLAAALTYLQQDCELCASRLPEHEMVSMLRCTHRCCRECARLYFTVQVSERSIADCVCPFCKVPELEGLPEDAWLEYFAHLDIQLKTLLETDVHELFQRKLRDRTLAMDPNFRWCMECSSGFFVHPKQKKLRCPECRSVSCASCRKSWSANHEGASCEQFAAWLADNDPEISVAAVQQHLKENGLECPRCHFKYSLSRGGCMHFTCTQCKYEFCYGCGKPFTMGARCGLSEYCAKLGLHAHHPRNCLFYLRDKEPHELQTLLQMNNVTYEAEAAEGSNGRCPIPLQRETPTGLVDGICGSEVPLKSAGLCKNHYLEYLTRLVRARGADPLPILGVDDLETLVRRAGLRLPPRPYGSLEGIYRRSLTEVTFPDAGGCRGHYVEYLAGLARALDPIPIMEVSELVAELRRRALPLPDRGPWDTDPIYAGMCAEIVKEKIPLD